MSKSTNKASRNSPIFVSTIFKSGTKLLEYLINQLTGLSVITPDMIHGYDSKNIFNDEESDKRITLEEGNFFIWHNVINNKVKAYLSEVNAKPILLIRNLYDLLVSQYYHFSKDVDKSIGHGTNTAEYFEKMDETQGISYILCGGTSEKFHWHGFGLYLHQIQEALKFSKEYPCHIIIYDRLVLNKHEEIERLASFLNLELSFEQIDNAMKSSSLTQMRLQRLREVGSGDHFRKGEPGNHTTILKPFHYDMVSYLKLSFAPELDALCKELQYGDVVAPKRVDL
tara:strand:- start:2412 stop:3260 length:849 start_codon:yes stop_codon:yes gene_type:complete